MISNKCCIMAITLKSNKWLRYIYITSRNYCDGKSSYQRNEEGNKPRAVYGKLYPEWRKPWIQRDGEWRSKLSLFVEKSPSPHIMNALQHLPHLNVQDVKNWWTDMKVEQEIQNQKYLPERTSILGSNLAAVHFFTYRQAAVRLKNSVKWICGDITSLNLPTTYEEGYAIEAIDCSNFHHNGLRYEGVQNLQGLNFLKWLSLKNNTHVDVWCLDRIAGQNGKSLEYLDLTGCKLCVGSVYALARMTSLKALVVTVPVDDIPVQVALSMLEEDKPNLLIKANT